MASVTTSSSAVLASFAAWCCRDLRRPSSTPTITTVPRSSCIRINPTITETRGHARICKVSSRAPFRDRLHWSSTSSDCAISGGWRAVSCSECAVRGVPGASPMSPQALTATGSKNARKASSAFSCSEGLAPWISSVADFPGKVSLRSVYLGWKIQQIHRSPSSWRKAGFSTVSLKAAISWCWHSTNPSTTDNIPLTNESVSSRSLVLMVCLSRANATSKVRSKWWATPRDRTSCSLHPAARATSSSW
mmetsp:Transcript_50612/g.133353  ORF Transcript_50612/g.133353 Transcript_50612/m.133353 type:complete len:248 (-) Transcript_50612:167-910(-)